MPKLCSVEGCTKYARRGKVCIRHGAKETRKPFNHEGCTIRAIKGGAFGRHGAKGTLCEQEGCTSNTQKGGVRSVRHPAEAEGVGRVSSPARKASGGGKKAARERSKSPTSPTKKAKASRQENASVHQQKWDRHCLELVEYRDKHGHCNVPQHDSQLGMWAKNQRTAHRHGKLAGDRVARLERLGFAWYLQRGRPRLPDGVARETLEASYRAKKQRPAFAERKAGATAVITSQGRKRADDPDELAPAVDVVLNDPTKDKAGKEPSKIVKESEGKETGKEVEEDNIDVMSAKHPDAVKMKVKSEDMLRLPLILIQRSTITNNISCSQERNLSLNVQREKEEEKKKQQREQEEMERKLQKEQEMKRRVIQKKAHETRARSRGGDLRTTVGRTSWECCSYPRSPRTAAQSNSYFSDRHYRDLAMFRDKKRHCSFPQNFRQKPGTQMNERHAAPMDPKLAEEVNQFLLEEVKKLLKDEKGTEMFRCSGHSGPTDLLQQYDAILAKDNN